MLRLQLLTVTQKRKSNSRNSGSTILLLLVDLLEIKGLYFVHQGFLLVHNKYGKLSWRTRILTFLLTRANDECCSTQLVHLMSMGLARISKAVKLAECGLSYVVVSVMGPQSSRKSTRLNSLLCQF
ncbi:uncharacterized protein LOC113354548 [Papaver somniferum]|uniref:uncharacterized protein LOC113354548 n=1 Tax=Papaver somniferum TaxID=3469 RepID=UPI000E6F6C54|nr:uncharacterized protein LOC113354548 [Papaver somniferum]